MAKAEAIMALAVAHVCRVRAVASAARNADVCEFLLANLALGNSGSASGAGGGAWRAKQQLHQKCKAQRGAALECKRRAGCECGVEVEVEVEAQREERERTGRRESGAHELVGGEEDGVAGHLARQRRREAAEEAAHALLAPHLAHHADRPAGRTNTRTRTYKT